MKKFKARIFSVISQEFEVEANSKEEARELLLEGHGDPISDQDIEGPSIENYPDGIGCIEESKIEVKCDQCQAFMINGLLCHESGCPNTHKKYVDGKWISQEEGV